MTDSNNSVSFVVPCLNEEDNLPDVLAKINTVCRTQFKQRRTEVLVCDNGSTDESARIARECGAQVVDCIEKGYGAALLCGISHASCDLVVFADADNTYDFLEAPLLVEELEKGFDMVIGSRLGGNIRRGAMPVLHRYVGTPFLNFLINLLYSRRHGRITDCNSGFRCFKREKFLSWGVQSKGMEFASEMLIKALKAEARISHVPVSLYPDRGARAPHLKRWRDGMRHLLQILLDCPGFFFAVGSVMFLLSWLVILSGLLFGPVSVGRATVLGLHSMMFGLIGSLFGSMIWAMGLFLSVRIDSNVRVYRLLIGISEDKLFWSSVALTLISFGLFGAIVVYWGIRGFSFIYIEKETLATVAFGANAMVLVFNVVTAHLLKRS